MKVVHGMSLRVHNLIKVCCVSQVPNWTTFVWAWACTVLLLSFLRYQSYRKIDLRLADALLGKAASCFLFCLMPYWRSALGEKNLLQWEQVLPFGSGILKGLYCPGKHTGSLMRCFPLWKG